MTDSSPDHPRRPAGATTHELQTIERMLVAAEATFDAKAGEALARGIGLIIWLIEDRNRRLSSVDAPGRPRGRI